jgi:hypothetical protein
MGYVGLQTLIPDWVRRRGVQKDSPEVGAVNEEEGKDDSHELMLRMKVERRPSNDASVGTTTGYLSPRSGIEC